MGDIKESENSRMDDVQWEYKMLPIKVDGWAEQDRAVNQANHYGSDGWEMCGIIPGKSGEQSFLWFKRVVT
jgi:hypothetical protein